VRRFEPQRRGSTTSESQTGVWRSAMPMSASATKRNEVNPHAPNSLKGFQNFLKPFPLTFLQIIQFVSTIIQTYKDQN